MKPSDFQARATIQRYAERRAARERNLRLIAERRYFEVDTPERVEKFLSRRGLSPTESYAPREYFKAPAADRGRSERLALERVLGEDNLLGVAFLEAGLQAARTVGRIWIGVASGRAAGYGTGSLVSPRLLLTNNHVLESKAAARSSLVEFNYEVSLGGSPRATTTFNLDPDSFFYTDQHLDYAVVAVQARAVSGQPLSAFGWNALIEDEGKAIAAQWVNIIQHPNGEYKQLAFRENQLIDILEDFVQYKTDTSPGSSGSPVYNDRWEIVALHHSGVWETNAAGQIMAIDGRVWREDMGEHRIKWIANEGARVSRIVRHIKRQPLSSAEQRLLEEAFSLPPTPAPRERTGETPRGIGSSDRPEAAAVVDEDGSATWTIPVTLTVRLGAARLPQAAPAIPLGATASTAPALSTGALAGAPADTSTAETLDAARAELARRADVLGVRLGYVFRDGWITRERALVVSVRRKFSEADLREARIDPLPESFRALPIEVTNPTLEELLAASGKLGAAREAFRQEAVVRQEIKYFPPPGLDLSPVERDMRVICHVSPDVGWPQLEAFLGLVRRRLVVGMFDFGAPHILEAVTSLAQDDKVEALRLVMQSGESVGEGTKADDLPDGKVVEALHEAFGDRFENAWVKLGIVNGWIASSYHIKVAVRDSSAFWLSSGNWQSSNQPPANPAAEKPPKREWLARYNREWHAIVEDEGLAKTFEALLLHDLSENRKLAPEELALPDLLVPEGFFRVSPRERVAPFKYFKAFDKKRKFAVEPLLTPDNYFDRVLRLVRGAKETLYIQNQTFNAAKEGQRKLAELLEAVKERQQARVDVRVIFRVLRSVDARANLERLQEFGFDMESFKVQKGCHTKGIVVDGEWVLLGSQNWSEHGVTVNRDASLLFRDKELGQYFTEIFEHDWNGLAAQDIGRETTETEIIGAEEATPDGMVRLSFKDYLETA